MIYLCIMSGIIVVHLHAWIIHSYPMIYFGTIVVYLHTYILHCITVPCIIALHYSNVLHSTALQSEHIFKNLEEYCSCCFMSHHLFTYNHRNHSNLFVYIHNTLHWRSLHRSIALHYSNVFYSIAVQTEYILHYTLSTGNARFPKGKVLFSNYVRPMKHIYGTMCVLCAILIRTHIAVNIAHRTHIVPLILCIGRT